LARVQDAFKPGKPASERPTNIVELAWRTMPEPQKRIVEEARRRQESELSQIVRIVEEMDAEPTAGVGSGGEEEEKQKEKLNAALARPEMRRLHELFEQKCVQLDRAVEAQRRVEDEKQTANAVAEEMATELEETLAHNERLRADYDRLTAEVLQLRQITSSALSVRAPVPGALVSTTEPVTFGRAVYKLQPCSLRSYLPPDSGSTGLPSWLAQQSRPNALCSTASSREHTNAYTLAPR
jgi:hypothetical protein